MKWKWTEPKDPNDPTSMLMADTIIEAYHMYDWLFVFEATMVTHLHADMIEECETMGSTLTDEMRQTHLMKNLNETRQMTQPDCTKVM
jgi:hypothetical protein